MLSVILLVSTTTVYAMGASTVFSAFVLVAMVCIVHNYFEQHTVIPTNLNLVSGGDHSADATKNGNVLQLRRLSYDNGHISDRHRSLIDAGHPLPHHSTVHYVHNTTIHKKAWMHYEVVDGLKNEEVVMFVMSSTVKDGYLLRERLVKLSTYSPSTIVLMLFLCVFLKSYCRSKNLDEAICKRCGGD